MQQAFKFKPADENAYSGARHLVAYQFPEPGHFNGIALIGEAPGAEEARLGKPFVGRSGQLLDKVLEKAGIERKACFVGNVFRSQPPGNKVDHFFISRRAATADKIEIAEQYGQFGSAWCRGNFAEDIHHLTDTLKKLKPKMIVSLGRTPLWALTGQNGLLDKVGLPLPCRLIPGMQVIPTYHPSFILRGNWVLEPKWVEHLGIAKERAL